MAITPKSAFGSAVNIYKDIKTGTNPLNAVIGEGLLTYRSLELDRQLTRFVNETPVSGKQPGVSTNVDWRARLRPKDGGRDIFWKGKAGSDTTEPKVDFLLRPLYESNGLVWQYTPNIFLSGRANYNISEFQGSNYPLVTYKNSQPPTIPITADFTANTVAEARYLLGVMHFLRVATKSFYGDTAVANGMYGTPPPVMLFEYLGDHGFNKVPVVVTEYSMQLDETVDYVPVYTNASGTEVTYVPTKTNIVISLQPSYTPHKTRKRFDLGAFATGRSYKDGFI
jgi:hypothetical protein